MGKASFERIYFYWRQSLYGHIHQLCRTLLKTNGVDPQILIYDALAYGAEGKVSSALEIFEKIKNRAQYGLPIGYASLWIHKKAPMMDFTAISAIENDINDLEPNASASSIVSAAQVLWMTGDYDKAFQLAQPLTVTSPVNKDAAVLVGWIKLAENDINSGRWFDMANADATGGQRIDPFVLYGKAMYFASILRWNDALSLLVQLNGVSDFPEAALERARIHIAANSWDLALESAQENSGHYISEVDLQFLTLLNQLSQKGDLDGARITCKQLVENLKQIESNNWEYITKVARLVIDLSWADKQLVAALFPLFPPLRQANSENAKFLTVYGELLNLVGKMTEAVEVFQAAIVQESSCQEAFVGLINAYIMQKNMNDAQSQLDFLEAIASSAEPTLALFTLKEKFARINGQPPHTDELLTAMERHVSSVQALFAPSQDVIQRSNQDKFVEQIIKMRLSEFAAALNEAMEHCTTLDRTVTDPINGPVCALLAKMLTLLPGSVPMSYYLAVLGSAEGNPAMTVKAIQLVLNSHWSFNVSECHLILAQVRLQMKQFDEAEAAMNRAVSFDFGIRITLRYNMIQAQLMDARGQFEKAIDIINNVMKTSEYIQAKAPERLNTHLFLARVQKQMKNLDAALKTVDDALEKFPEKEFSEQIRLFKASLLANSGRVQEGLQILDSFTKESQHFQKAKKAAAKIYLNNLKDRAGYIRCFKQLTDAYPTTANQLLLGDALIKVKRFDEAVGAFENAAVNNPENSTAALRFAHSLMIVHRYDEAIDAFKAAAHTGNRSFTVNLELARYLFKLRNYDEAMEVANEEMNEMDSTDGDWEEQFCYAQFAELVSALENAMNGQPAPEYIQEALDIYDKLTASSRVDIPADQLKSIQQRAAELYQRSASGIMKNGGDPEIAIGYYRRAAELTNTTKPLLSLARIYSESGKTEEAKAACHEIIRADPKCEEAAILLAEISSNENLAELEAAFFESPTFYRTLVRLIEICARSGDLDRVPGYFEKCSGNDPGLLFCRGLYEYYIGAAQSAIRHFHECRNDPDWGVNALAYTFHIYTNPSRRFNWCEEKPLATPKELEAAEKILRRLGSNDVDTEMYEATLLLSKNTTESVQQALALYEHMDGSDENVTIGKCRCYIRLGQVREATRNLNSLVHADVIGTNTSVYVEANLMMTHLMMKEGSLDEADGYIQKAIDLDKSACKAWEMLAAIFEKRHDYIGAAEALSQAMELTSKSDMSVMYRLALNYMKAKSPVDAIKIARLILEKHPNFPKVKDQILIPCCQMLREA